VAHTHFVVNGQRFRQSLGTTDWREAQAKEKELVAQASDGKLSHTNTGLARQPFGLAADDYVAARHLELAPASRAKEKQLLVQLRAYFKDQPLKSITVKKITDYRTWRAAQSVGPATLNAELGILRRMLKRAKLWARVADDVRPLKEPSTIGRALTEDDKQRLLRTAVMKPEWETAYLAAILCLNTTARGCELKGLQWSDIDLFQRTITIRKTKTAGGRAHDPPHQRCRVRPGAVADTGGIVRPSRAVALRLRCLRSEVQLQRDELGGLQRHGLRSDEAYQ
jgi:integrase